MIKISSVSLRRAAFATYYSDQQEILVTACTEDNCSLICTDCSRQSISSQRKTKQCQGTQILSPPMALGATLVQCRGEEMQTRGLPDLLRTS